MMDSIIPGIFAIIGVILGLFGSYTLNKQNRKDKFLLASIDKKFEVYQKAYILSRELKYIVHESYDVKSETTQRALDWYHENNLYLEPSIRNDFFNTIDKINNYKELLIEFSQEREKGESEETKRLRKEISETFKEIMTLDKRIQKSINVYYDL